MKKNILILLFLPFLTGCSWLSQILIVNKSIQTIVVRFSVPKSSYADVNFNPSALKIDSWKNDTTPVFSGDTVHVYSRKENDSTWYVELPPNRAIVIAEAANLDLRNDEQLKRLLGQIERVNIVLPDDAVIECAGEGCMGRINKFTMARAGIIVR